MNQPSSDHRLVVVADDDVRVRRQIEATLISAGFEVHAAEDGLSAWHLIAERCPDFIIADAEMPGLSGTELARRLRDDECPHYVYFLLLTSRLGADDLGEALAAGVDHFLPKPVSTTELLAQVFAGSRVLEARRQLDKTMRRDSLTGLLNRRLFQELFDRDWSRAERHRAELSCALVEIVDFEQLAQTHGDGAADMVLRSVADLLRSHARASDLLCHLGNGHFLALLPDTHEEGAASWCRRVNEAVAAKRLPESCGVTTVSLRVGVAARVPHLEDPEALVDRARQALEVSRPDGTRHVVQYRDLDDSDNTVSHNPHDELEALSDVRAADLMTSPVACLGQDETVADAADFLVARKINAAPVVDDTGHLVGVISERELMDWLPTENGGQQPLLAVMNTTVVSYEDDAPAHSIFRFLQRVAVRRVIILREGQPVGIISRGNLIRWFRRQQTVGRPVVPAVLLTQTAASLAT
ncbi:MAG: diguanylate cyclase [Pirellulales bacterium]|nr:diguanylate cyclase [Pirellulales bacterium]